ncbi:MAG: CHAT domain-containing protein [Nitrospina sp.]|nr:CHAT domain-containing protein [Nitrospina sp.]MBT4047215.1 CHAT domain-containing protein [Nitrospina sp.]MBT4556061.1 CHAT domain-containing protein [Nitrospina sp.]MBT5349016.1 CHAT domain-containing protein [Nitrospina sp.]MBT6738827.1 CHAT domain-containing protein [Nitrospina sp.]
MRLKLRQLILFLVLFGMTTLVIAGSAIEAHSEEEKGAYDKGVDLLESGDYRSAIPHLREAIRSNPSYHFAHYWLGNAYEKLGRNDEAVAEYKEAIRLEPKYFDARESLKQLEQQIAQGKTSPPVNQLPPRKKQGIAQFNSPWELQAHLKHLNEYKLFSSLKTFLENNYSNSSLNLETRLYILDDLANLYATKLIDFKKADEFNKKAQDLYTSLSSRDFKELAFSNYFNENRLISDLFYFSPDALQKEANSDETQLSIIGLEDKTLAERSDLTTGFSQEMIDHVRKEDLLATGDRIQRRVTLLQTNLGIQSVPVKNVSLEKGGVLKGLESENQENSLSDREKNYLLAKYSWLSLSPNASPDQYLPIIQFGEKAISQQEETNPDSLVLLCRLHYWVGMSHLKTGQTQAGITHLDKFDQSIEKLENAVRQGHEDQKLFIDDIEKKIKANLQEDQLSDEKWLDFWTGTKKFGSAMLEGVGQVALYTLLGMVAVADAYSGAYGGQTLSYYDWHNLTEGTAKLSTAMHEGGTAQREEIEYEHQLDAVELQAKYVDTQQDIEEKFSLQKNNLTLQHLKYARFMGPNDQLDFFVARGDGLSASGDSSGAKELYLNALSLIEKQRATIDSDTKRIVFSGHRNSIYVKLIEIYSQENDAEEAFHLVERSKGRVFADLLESKNLQLARNEESDFYQSYLMKNSEMNEILSHGSISFDQIKYLEENRGIHVSSKFRTTPLIEFNNLDEAKPITLEETQSLLAKPTIDSDFVQYFVAPEKTIIVLAGGTPNIMEVPVGKEQLIKKVSRFRELISAGSENQVEFLSLSQELYEILIKPIAIKISKNRVIISPHGPLHYLPFQLLHDGEKYLIENHTLNYIPSATVLRYLANKSPIGPLDPDGESEFSATTVTTTVDDSEYLPGWGAETVSESVSENQNSGPPKSILLLGNPELDNEALNLPYSEIEIDNASTFFPDSVKLSRSEASETNLKNKASSYDVLHFATHATFDNDEPFNSSLLLASDGSNDGKLTVEEIYQLQLKPSLVVLSACDTGLGKYSAGDEIIGFYRAFMYAGAKSIIATLWPVSDEATSFLINEFYQSLKKNSLGESLRMAQLKTKEKYPNPANWGGFILVGRN